MEERSDHGLTDLVAVALRQDKLSGLSAMLETLAKRFGAAGSILYELVPDPSPKVPEDGILYVLAEWLEDRRIAGFYDLSMRRSVSGRAIFEGEPQWIDDVARDPRVDHHREWVLKAGIRSLASLPVSFNNDKKGALGIYRRSGRPFSGEDKIALGEFAALVPSLYDAVRNRVSFELVHRANLLLQRSSSDVGDVETPQDEIRPVLKSITRLLAESFDCLEATIYLRDPKLEPDAVRLQATTWERSTQVRKIGFATRKGLTAWVVRNRQPMALFNLRDWPRQREEIRVQYPGLWWEGLGELEQEVRADPRMATFRELLPPLSFMAVPILAAEQLLGVVHCFAATRPPFLFAEREIRLLEIIAAGISDLWNTILRRRDVEEENQVWRRIIQGLDDLNTFTLSELARPERLQDPQALIAKTLDMARSAIPSSEEMMVYLAKSKYQLVSPPEARSRVNVSTAEGPLPEGGISTAGDAEHLIAPINDVTARIGVLMVQSASRQKFTEQEHQVATLLGRQLGLYFSVANAIDELKSTGDELKAKFRELQQLQETQHQAYENLSHQLKSPIFQAFSRIQTVVAKRVPEERLASSLEAIRSLCRQAKRVVQSLNLFADLARDGLLFARSEPLTYPYLKTFLIEAAADATFLRLKATNEGGLVVPTPTVHFRVERESFRVLRNHRVLADRGLLEYAVNNLLDNAGKYSYENTWVVILGGTTKKGRFYISVTSTGLRIRSDEVKKVIKRGWRSTDAEEVTSEGTGIGLWLVDNIMQAHKGSLYIEPTKKHGRTEMKLIFPIETV